MEGKTFVYEFLSGEGAGVGLHADVAVEGAAMLLGVAGDFAAAGFKTFTIISPGLGSLVGEFTNAGVEVKHTSFSEGVNEADYCLVIAPESGGVLQRLVREVEGRGKIHLGPDSESVAITTDKVRTLELAESVGLNVPLTLEFRSVDEAVGKAWDIGFPVVFKPVDGVGCEGASVVWREEEIERAARLALEASGVGRAVAQEYVKGVDASVSVIVGERGARSLTLNAQVVSRGEDGRLRYEGGYVPLKHEARDEAFKVAEKLVSSIPGLRGYVGVDLVLSPMGVFVMEVNPRITTSYLGVRMVVDGNVARYIFDACTKGVVPRKVKVRGVAAFRKAAACEAASWRVSLSEGSSFAVFYERSTRKALAKAGITPITIQSED